MIQESHIHSVLDGIKDPLTGKSLEIGRIVINDGNVYFAIKAGKAEIIKYQEIRNHLGSVISKLTGVKKVSITLTEDLNVTASSSAASGAGNKGKERPPKRHLDGVKKIIVVASAKGGVGKSSVAANLAAALSQLGKRVALVDLDIYGPSLPSLFALDKKPSIDNNKISPLEKFGIKLNSIGFLVDVNKAVVWRGPMTTKMVYQLLDLTNWRSNNEEVDYMIIDTPPGTGDVHLSLYENYVVDGAIVVSTPQALAGPDVARGLDMFAKLKIPVFGIVENMSYLPDSDGKKQYIFGKSSVSKIAKEFHTKVIAELPIDPEINVSAQKGKPMVLRKPKAPSSQEFIKIAKEISGQLL